MKSVILAGGMGTRLSEETVARPKPMVEIGGKPILWHILNIYGAQGVGEFVIALGYKAEMIKEYFLNFYALNNDLTVNLADGSTEVHEGTPPKWKIHLIDTGQQTQTGGRMKRLKKWIDSETFMMTYGDGVANVDVKKLLAFHRSHGKLATVTAVRPPSRFGGIRTDGDRVVEFVEKPQAGEGWINGGFFVLEPKVLDFIPAEETIFERGPLENLARQGQLMTFRHEGFFQPMDTVRDKALLEDLWARNQAPWKIW